MDKATKVAIATAHCTARNMYAKNPKGFRPEQLHRKPPYVGKSGTLTSETCAVGLAATHIALFRGCEVGSSHHV
jgi:hypothetical protein